MDQLASNFTALENHVDSPLRTPYDPLSDPYHISGAGKWIFFLAISTGTTVLWLLWAFVLRLWLLRRYYEKQGIRFVKDCYAVVGAEMRVEKLRERNQSHDYLYTDRPTDLYGTMRGFSIQLYATSAGLCEELLAQTGKHVDRNTPALFSFGQLSPNALSFSRTHKGRFLERKNALTRGMKVNKRLYEIVARQAEEAMKRVKIKDGSGATINVRELLNHWTREMAGEIVWGRNNINRCLEVLDSNGDLKSFRFMTALNNNFTDLRFYALRFWNRVCFPLATLPLTKEARRLRFNVKVLRKAIEDMMSTPEDETVAANVQEANLAIGIPDEITRDDLTTGTIAGLDPVKATLMGALYHLLRPANLSWRQQIMAEIKEIKTQPGEMYIKLSHAPKLNAFVDETLRYDPPGSLLNNEAVNDFDLSSGDRQYKIKSGTRIVSCIHALHQNEESWKQNVSDDMAPLSEFDPGRFLLHANDIVSSSCFMPFGKGPRRCPGQRASILMVKAFIVAFLTENYNCKMSVPENQTDDVTWFSIYSRATFDIHCDEIPASIRSPIASTI
jgi:hypothetical protein